MSNNTNNAKARKSSTKASKSVKGRKAAKATKATKRAAGEVKYHIEANRPTKAGITRRSKGTQGRALWDAFDKAKPATLEAAREVGAKVKANANTTVIAFYRWRKFNGFKRPVKAK